MSTPETPYTRDEMYLSAIADGDSSGIPDRPYTRKEKYLDAIATGDSSGIPDTPYTREEMYLDAIAKNGGGGGGGSTLIDKNVSANGTYNASDDNADGYKKVTVNVPNSYAAGDEGKVVSNGQLVAQTAHAEVTANGTIDTTLNNSVVVNVPTGGGSSWELLASEEYTVSTTSTTAQQIGNISIPNLANKRNEKVLLITVADKAGKRNGYFKGSVIMISHTPATTAGQSFYYDNSGFLSTGTYSNGVYPSSIQSDNIVISAKYGNAGTINGTYVVSVYEADTPPGSPFA